MECDSEPNDSFVMNQAYSLQIVLIQTFHGMEVEEIQENDQQVCFK